MHTVVVFGTFDFVHVGHIAALKEARTLGERLVVVVTHDDIVQKLKGAASTHTAAERQELLSHIDIVDEVQIGDAELSTYNILDTVDPDCVAVGYDQVALAADLERYRKTQDLHFTIHRLTAHAPERVKSQKVKQRLGL